MHLPNGHWWSTNVVINSTATDTISIRQLTFAMILRDIDNQVKLMIGNHLHHVVSAPGFSSGQYTRSGIYTVCIEESSRSGSSINLISLRKQSTAGIQQINFWFHGTGREHNTFLFEGILNPVEIIAFSRASEVITDTTHLTGWRHIYTQNSQPYANGRMRTEKPLHQSSRYQRQTCRTAVWSVKHDTGSCFDKVTFQYFRHEWKHAKHAGYIQSLSPHCCEPGTVCWTDRNIKFFAIWRLIFLMLRRAVAK